MTTRGAVFILSALLPCTSAPSAAQVITDTTQVRSNSPALDLLRRSVRVSGGASVSSDLYHASGIAARRPGSAWRIALTPQLTLFGDIRFGLDILMSSEGSDLRQNLSQIGVHPQWSWGALHLGDFSQGISRLTVQGTRIRGVGIDLTPGALRFGIQAGRAQRAVAAGLSPVAYRRDLVAGRVGWGHDDGSFIEIQMLKARDDPNSLGSGQVVNDTLLVDTIPEALRPDFQTRPQENVVGGVTGQLSLFDRAFVVRGDIAAALITRDMTSPSISADSTEIPDIVASLQPLRASSSADLAWGIDGALRLSRGSLRGSYDVIGPGYTSLGLPYFSSDREMWQTSGNVQVLGGRLQLQSAFAHERNNLLGQKETTTARSALSGSVTARITSALTTTITGVQAQIGNDAAIDTFLVDNRTRALTTTLLLQAAPFGKPSVASITYGIHGTDDRNVIVSAPAVRVHNATLALQVNITPALSLAPSVSAVRTEVDGGDVDENLYLGFRGSTRAFDGRLRLSADVSHTISNGREMSGAGSQLSITLPGNAVLSLQARHTRHNEFGERPSFAESFVTMSVARSFIP